MWNHEEGSESLTVSRMHRIAISEHCGLNLSIMEGPMVGQISEENRLT